MASPEKAAVGLHMQMPTWDGKAETLAEYRGEVELLVLGTPSEQRTLLGARPVAALPRNSMARRLAMRLPRTPDKEKEDETGEGQGDNRSIASRDGAMNLVRAFEENLGIQVVADVGDKTDR